MGSLTDIPAGTCRIAVVEGRPVVDAAAADAPPAVVHAEEGVTLILDGRPVAGPVPVGPDQVLDVDLGHTEPSVALEVEVAAGGMEARLHVTRRPGHRYGLADAPPAAEVTLRRVVVEEFPAPLPDPAAIATALAAAQVSVGVEAAEVARAAAGDGPGPFVVARGVPAAPAVDAQVTLPFAAERQRNPLHTVPRGTLVAVKTPAREGSPGTTVTGTPVPVHPPRDAPLAAGLGVVRSVDAAGVIRLHAAVDGRPGVAGPTVVVEARITHSGDIDVATGDVDVRGSLVITGTVHEGRRVRVSGDLEIIGGVDRADVESGETLTVLGPALHSRLRAGVRQALRTHLLAVLDDAPEDLDALVTTLAAMTAAAAARGTPLPLGRALIGLLEGHFATLPSRLAQAAAIITHNPGVFAADVEESVGALLHATSGLGPHELPDEGTLAALVTAFGTALEPLRQAVAAPAETRVSYMQRCEMETSGPLLITGPGVYTSEIFVGGDLHCESGTSTVRGGVTRATGRVRVHELGGDGGARTVVALDGGALDPERLHVDVVHAGVRVQIAGAEIVYDRVHRDVVVGLDTDGSVIGL